MAAGLGTRMRSRVAEAPAPAARPPDGRLGDRGRAVARRRPARRRRLARHAPTQFDGVDGRGPGGAARHRRRRPLRARRARGTTDDVLVLSGDTPLLTAELLARARRRRTARAGAAATVLSFVPPDARSYGRIVRDERRQPRAHRRGRATRRRTSWRSREVNSSIYVFRADAALAGARPARAAQRAGRALPDGRAPPPRRGRRAGRRARRARPAEADGVNTRVELAAAAAVLRDRINERAHARGRDDRRPGDDLDRAGVELEADAVDPSVHRPARRDARRDGRRGRPARGRRRRACRSGCPRRPVLLPSPRHRCSRRREGRARSWRSRTRASARARRCRTSRTSVTPTSARTRTSPPGTSPRTSRTSPAAPKGGRRSGATSGPASTMRSSPL